MPPKKPKKKAGEMTTEELAKRLFPKELKEELQKAANEPKGKNRPPNNSQD